MIFSCFDTVMFSDVDMSGMGHFAQQIRLLERAEYQFMAHVGLPPQEWFMKRYLFPRVKLDVQFFSPLQFADEIRFDVQVGHMGTTSFSLDTHIVKVATEEKAMWSRMVMVVLDPKTGQPTPLPAEMREAFTPYLVDSQI